MDDQQLVVVAAPAAADPEPQPTPGRRGRQICAVPEPVGERARWARVPRCAANNRASFTVDGHWHGAQEGARRLIRPQRPHPVQLRWVPIYRRPGAEDVHVVAHNVAILMKYDTHINVQKRQAPLCPGCHLCPCWRPAVSAPGCHGRHGHGQAYCGCRLGDGRGCGALHFNNSKSHQTRQC